LSPRRIVANWKGPGFVGYMSNQGILPLLVAAIAASVLLPCARAAEVAALAPAEAAARVAAGKAVLVDVREAGEWEATGVVASAHLLALSDLRGPRARWKPFLEANREKELIFYCRSGGRSGQAARLLAEEGFRTANAGGLKDWIADGQPLRKADEPPKTP